MSFEDSFDNRIENMEKIRFSSNIYVFILKTNK